MNARGDVKTTRNEATVERKTMPSLVRLGKASKLTRGSGGRNGEASYSRA